MQGQKFTVFCLYIFSPFTPDEKCNNKQVKLYGERQPYLTYWKLKQMSKQQKPDQDERAILGSRQTATEKLGGTHLLKKAKRGGKQVKINIYEEYTVSHLTRSCHCQYATSIKSRSSCLLCFIYWEGKSWRKKSKGNWLYDQIKVFFPCAWLYKSDITN